MINTCTLAPFFFFFLLFIFRQVKRHYRPMGGERNNAKNDHPMSASNPVGSDYYAEIDNNPRESGPEPFTNGDLNITPEPLESQEQLPSLPSKRKARRHTGLPPTVPETPRPIGAVEALAMGIFHLSDQQHPRGASVDTGRLNAYPPSQKRDNSKPTPFSGARRPSEPCTSLTEENAPQGTHPSAISGDIRIVYSNMQSSKTTDPSHHLPKTSMPQTTIP